MNHFRKAKETLFGMQFVLTDGTKKNSGNPMRSLMILFIIDALQVFRVMLSPAYGWNSKTYGVAKHADMVYNVTALLSLLVRRFTFFGLAFFLVVFAVGDAFYCAWLFKSGEINKIGPIKALRFMVATLVTTLFSSVMKWLLIPLECLHSKEGNFSENFHGKGAECTPFGFPEILASVPTLIVIVLYVAFAITVAFFSLGTNPLSCAPHVQFTGRVEALFILAKVFATFMPYLSDTITPIGVATIQCALFLTVLRKHLALLPFHHLPTNMLRGGIYFAIGWLSLSSVVVAALDTLDILSDEAMQTMQWLLVGATFAAFPVGILLVWRRRTTINFFIDRLRGEFETKNQMLRTGAGRKSRKKGGSVPPSEDLTIKDRKSEEYDSDDNGSLCNSDSTPIKVSDVAKVGGTKPRGALEQFFNPSWERKRAFSSAQDALSALRALLMTRSEAELPFLRYMMMRATEEHPDSQELQVLNVSLLRFVFCNTAESSKEEKRLRTASTAPAVDHEYLLYAIKRKAAQDFAAASIGNGVINAINLMEFNSRMQQARTAHMQCITELRKFWSGVSSSKKCKEKEGLQQTIDRLVEFNRYVREAKAEYQTLMDKYPQSTQVIATYIAFCDTVLNDPSLANELRKQADALQDDDDRAEGRGDEKEVERAQDPAWQTALEQRSQRSGTSGASENSDYRVKIQRAFAAWSAEIFGGETKDLRWVAQRLKVCFGVLFLCSAAGFGVMQFFLFESYAKRDSHLINQTGILRTIAVSALYSIRSQLMAAWSRDAQTFHALGQQISESAKDMQTRHYDNYQLARGTVADFYSGVLSTHDLNVPYASGWQVESKTYWNFGNEIAQRLDRASAATMGELLSSDYSVEEGHLPESKISILFLTENTFRVGIPTFNEVVSLYQEEMQSLWSMTQSIVLSSTGASLATLVVILALVVLRLFRTISTLQHLHLACHLAIALPLATTRKISKFYQDAERDMQSLVDEDAAKLGIENDGPDNDNDNEEEKKAPGDAGEEGADWASGLSLKPRPGRAPMARRHSVEVMERWSEEGSPVAMARRHASPRARGAPGDDSSSGSGEAEAPAVMSLVEDNLERWTQHLSRQDVLPAHPALPAPSSPPSALRPPGARSPNRRVSLPGSTPPARATPPSDSAHAEVLVAPIPALALAHASPEPQPEQAAPEAEARVEEVSVSVEALAAAEAEAAGALGGEGRAGSPLSGRGGRKKGRNKARPRPASDFPPLPAPAPAQPPTPEPLPAAPPASLPSEGEAAPPAGTAPSAPEDEAGGAGKKAAERKAGDEEGEWEEEEEEEEEAKSAGARGGHSPALSFSKRAEPPRDESSLSRASLSIRTKGRTLMTGIGGILKRAQQQSFSGRGPRIVNGSFVGGQRRSALPGSRSEGNQEESLMAEEDKNRLPLREVTEATELAIKLCAKRHQRFTARTWVWVVSMSLVVALGMLLNWFPARRMSTLVTLAPTINHAGRRRTLTRACIHLTRELVINDGFARMSKKEVAEALTFYLSELRTANDAVRLGGALDIKVGADARNVEHNRIMYMEGCEWREDPSDCSYPLRPGVASKGLYQLSLSFMQAIESVLDRYAPPGIQPLEPGPRDGEDPLLHEYDHVWYNHSRAQALLAQDPDVAFVLDMYDGDLYSGYASIVRLFDKELQAVIDSAMSDNQALFIVYVLVTFGAIYFFLFLRSVKEAYSEGDEARTFVARIPAHTLSPLEVETLSFIFQGRHSNVPAHDE